MWDAYLRCNDIIKFCLMILQCLALNKNAMVMLCFDVLMEWNAGARFADFDQTVTALIRAHIAEQSNQGAYNLRNGLKE